MPPTTKISRDYMTLEELCGYKAHELRGNPKCKAFTAMQEQSRILRKVVSTLKTLGMQRFQYINNGRDAIILRCVDDQVVRISYGEEYPRVNHPCILQPIKAFHIDNFERPLRIEILPQIKFGNEVVQDEMERAYAETRLTSALRKSHLHPADATVQNIAYLPDGTPILTDAGDVRRDEILATLTHGDHLAEWLTRVNDKSVWKQHAYFPATQSELLSGVIGRRRAGEMRKTFGKDFEPLKLASDGLYPSELKKLADEARFPLVGMSFTARLRKFAAEYDKKQTPPDTGIT